MKTSIRPRVSKKVQGRRGKRRFVKTGSKLKQATPGSLLSKMAGSMY